MKNINKIEFKNFKAFYGEEELNLEGKNLLLYGENGSGKSSIYWAIYTFMQSSTKTQQEIAKYFVNFDDADPATYESLKNVYCSDTDDSYLRLETIDELNVKTRHEINATHANTNQSDKTIALANASSDFIHYKLLFKFYDLSHKHTLNLWPVFMRDIFPFYRNAETDPDYRQRIEELETSLPVDAAGNKARLGTGPRIQYDEKINNLNSEIELFLNEVQQNSNDFLKEHFCNGNDELEILLRYENKITHDTVEEKVKKNIPPEYSITLFVNLWDKNLSDWRIIRRPHSFLNEALLTRIAFSIRIGALRTRLQTNDYKVLCLDDMLISLDMGNRDKLIQLILNTENKRSLDFFDEYQKLIFTHDKAFFNLCKQRIRLSGKKDKWNIKEIYRDTDCNPVKPYIERTTDYFDRAEKHLKAFDYPASANALRQGLENLIFDFLPAHKKVKILPNKRAGTTKKLLGDLLEALKEIHEDYGLSVTDINNVFVYKDHLLNPLSHDNLLSSVYKDEIKSVLALIPKLEVLESELFKELTDSNPIIKFKDRSLRTGYEVTFVLEIKESVRRYTLLDGNKYLSKGEILMLQRIDNRTQDKLKKFDSLRSCVNWISNNLNTSYPTDDDFLSKIDFS